MRTTNTTEKMNPKPKPEDAFVKILSGGLERLDLTPGQDAELDLGCGKGRFTCDLAARHPERRVLGADIMLKRLRKVHRRAERMGLTNVTTLRTDAWELFARALPDACLRRVHLLCPDPWPKIRHRKNRLVSSEFVGRLRRVLQDNGSFHFSSDDEPYFADVARILDGSGLFLRDDSVIDDVRGVKTEFELLWESQGLTVRHVGWRAL